jgi:polar amino acid transport system substrate-binding protein
VGKKRRILIFSLTIIFVIVFIYSRPYIFTHKSDNKPFAASGSDLTSGLTDQVQKKSYKDILPLSKPLYIPCYVWPPFNIKNKDKTWSGADADISKAVLSRMGYTVKWLDMPFKRILEEMRKGTYAVMLPCVIGGGREDYMLFSAPVSSIYSVLWKKKNDPFEWQKYDDLKGKTVGASFYHYGAGFFDAANKKQKFTLDMVAHKTPELVHFRKLIEGKTNLFICELSVGLYIRHENRPEFDEVTYCRTGVGPARPFCLPVSRKYFEGHENAMHQFINDFNLTLAAFGREGKSQEIFDRYHMMVKLDEAGQVVISKEGNFWYE